MKCAPRFSQIETCERNDARFPFSPFYRFSKIPNNIYTERNNYGIVNHLFIILYEKQNNSKVFPIRRPRILIVSADRWCVDAIVGIAIPFELDGRRRRIDS